MTNEEKAVIDAAIEIRGFMPTISIIEGSYKDNFVKAVDYYLISQNEVKEIEEITSNPEYMTDLCFKREVINQLNETIRTVNKLARGK